VAVCFCVRVRAGLFFVAWRGWRSFGVFFFACGLFHVERLLAEFFIVDFIV
jgi:hypothetical protein